MRCISLFTVVTVANLAFAIQPPATPVELPAPKPAMHQLLGSINDAPDSWRIKSPMGDVSTWQAFHFEHAASIAMSTGVPLPFVRNPFDDTAIRRATVTFIERHSEDFGTYGSVPSVQSIKRIRNLTAVTVHFRIDDVPVFDSDMVLSLNSRGELTSVKAHGYGSGTSGRFKLTKNGAVELARSATGISTGKSDVLAVWFPRRIDGESIVLRPVFRVELTGKHPADRPTLFVDADTGDILAAENRVFYVDAVGQSRGFYFPVYGTDEWVNGIFPDEWVDIVGTDSFYTDAEGYFSQEVDDELVPFTVQSKLSGRWANVQEFDLQNGRFMLETDGEDSVTVLWDGENSRDDERNLYFHVNFIHDFWLDFDPDLDELNIPLLSVCGVGGEGFEGLEDNALSAGLEGLYFGRGRNYDNFALYADVIYHEYAHTVTAVVYQGYNLPYEGESGALNEAWSDYFTCSILDEPLIGEGGLMGRRYMRNLDNELEFPDDMEGQVHADSRIVSAAMWHSREVIGRVTTDSLFHYARYLHARDFRGFFLDVLLTDDDDGDLTNGSPHYRILYEQFGRHGIGLGDVPFFIFAGITLSDENVGGVSGDGDGLWEPGETIGIDVSVFRAGGRVPPVEEPVSVSVETDHPSIAFDRDVILLGELAIGERVDSPESLLMEITEDADVSFANLYFAASTGENEPEGRDTLRIAVGLPPLLLVRDGSDGFDRSEFLHSALDSIGVVYSDFHTADSLQPVDRVLSLYPTIIWYTGDSEQDLLAEPARQAIAGHIERGGDILLTGQSAGSIPEAEEFLPIWFQAENTIDSLYGRQVLGIEDDPVGMGMTLLLLGGDGARNQVRPGAVAAVDRGVECLYWDRIEGNPGAGVRAEHAASSARTVYLSFGLEAIGGAGRTNSRADVLSAILEWFDEPRFAPKTSLLPAQFTVGEPYPNPFNSTIRVPFTVRRPGFVSTRVFNVAGRILFSEIDFHHIGGKVNSLNFNVTESGTYFIEIAAGEKVETRRVVLLK